MTLDVRQSAFIEGAGFIRADEVVPSGVVPEPASAVLVATGLAGIAAAGRA